MVAQGFQRPCREPAVILRGHVGFPVSGDRGTCWPWQDRAGRAPWCATERDRGAGGYREPISSGLLRGPQRRGVSVATLLHAGTAPAAPGLAPTRPLQPGDRLRLPLRA